MKTRRRPLFWLLVSMLGWLLCRPHLGHAMALDLTKPTEERSHYQSPEDLIDKIPLLNELPRSFVWGRGYSMKISGQTLRINHLNPHAKPEPTHDCFLAFSYVTPVAGFFTSRIEVPLFYAPTTEAPAWSMNHRGDYAASFSRGASESKALRLAFSAKF